MHYYRIKLTRLETGNNNKWITPFYFTKRELAVKEAKYWDRFFEKKYDEKEARIWKSEIVSYKISDNILKSSKKLRKKVKDG